MNYKRKFSFVSFLVVIILLFASLFFINPKNIFAEPENIILKSIFLKDDPTAKSIISGQIAQYDIRALPLYAPFDTTIFAFRFISALRMLGYTASFMPGNTAEAFLNNFERANGYTQSPFITKQILIQVDEKLAQVESRDFSLANNFPLYKYYVDSPLNEPPKEHVVALFSTTLKNLPTNLITWSKDGFVGYVGAQLEGYVKFFPESDLIIMCNPTMHNEIRDLCKIDPAINYVNSYSNDFSGATLLLHEYAHYLDGNIYTKSLGTSRGIIDTSGFYGISYNFSDKKVAENGWKFYTYKNPLNIENEFLSSYAKGWSFGDNSPYYTGYEDFAESFYSQFWEYGYSQLHYA